jgi:hypothetical protein
VWGVGQAPFAGTIFRLPLRTRAQCIMTELCSDHLSLDDVRRALHRLSDDDTLKASLRHLQHIEVRESHEPMRMALLSRVHA